MEQANKFQWHILLRKAYRKTDYSLVKLAEILGVPKLTVRTWLRRPSCRPRGVAEHQATLEGFVSKPHISGPNKSTRHRMWQSMRCLRFFTVDNIMSTAEVGLSTAQKYIRVLTEAGYLRVCDKQGHKVYWALIKNTGPKAPEVGRNRDYLFDPNTDSLSWQKSEVAGL